MRAQHPVTARATVAHGTLKAGHEESVQGMWELRQHVATRIGKIAMPANVVFTPEPPKTRSGKSMRRLLRDIAQNRALGDPTTLADPRVVAELRARAGEEGKEEWGRRWGPAPPSERGRCRSGVCGGVQAGPGWSSLRRPAGPEPDRRPGLVGAGPGAAMVWGASARPGTGR